MDQIDKHNSNGMNLRGLITVAPRSLVHEQARNLDNERKSTGPRGPMHGIPVLVKVAADAFNYLHVVVKNRIAHLLDTSIPRHGHHLWHRCPSWREAQEKCKSGTNGATVKHSDLVISGL
jgi:hypothetical protein